MVGIPTVFYKPRFGARQRRSLIADWFPPASFWHDHPMARLLRTADKYISRINVHHTGNA